MLFQLALGPCGNLFYLSCVLLSYLCSDDDHEEKLRKQRDIIENLKNDRTHYREEAEKLRFVGCMHRRV